MAPVRTGIPTLLKLAQAVCVFIGKWSDVIVLVTDSDPDVIDALDKMNAACTVLIAVLTPYRPTGD